MWNDDDFIIYKVDKVVTSRKATESCNGQNYLRPEITTARCSFLPSIEKEAHCSIHKTLIKSYDTQDLKAHSHYSVAKKLSSQIL